MYKNIFKTYKYITSSSNKMVSFHTCVFCKFIFLRNKNHMLSSCNNKKPDWIFKHRKSNRHIHWFYLAPWVVTMSCMNDFNIMKANSVYCNGGFINGCTTKIKMDDKTAANRNIQNRTLSITWATNCHSWTIPWWFSS